MSGDDDGFRRTPATEHEWAEFRKMLYAWNEVKPLLDDVLAIVKALSAVKRASPYIAIIAAITLASINSDLLLGFLR